MFSTGDSFLNEYPTAFMFPCNPNHQGCCDGADMKYYPTNYMSVNPFNYFDYPQYSPIGKPWVVPSQTYYPIPEVTMAEDDALRGTEVSPLNPEPAPPASAETLANLEKLSQGFEPEVTGPLIGELQSSKALEEQYAGADPAFVRKTTALSREYSHYRHVKGDGRCGWRALVFGYFESIMKSGDHNFVASEIERVTTLNNLLESAGHSSFLYEDFVEETIEVFRAITSSTAFGGSYDDKPILEAFTNEERSEAIVTHAKLLTSSYMKSCPEQYAPFLDEGMDIERFCSSKVDPVGAEMEHISANALIDCLILPAGFAVEIFYLDRSEGDEVNVYRFEKPADGKSKPPEDPPVIRLLYRPGHYDLIYKNSDVEKLPSPLKGQHAGIDMPPLTVGIAQTLESDAARAFDRIFAEVGDKFSSLSTSQLTPSPQLHDVIPEALPPTQLSWSEDLPRTVLRNRKSSVMDSMPSNFRPSVFQFKAMDDVGFQSSSSLSSQTNTSHFKNENFQPEMYSPHD